MSRAISSLPVPLSPVMRTVVSVNLRHLDDSAQRARPLGAPSDHGSLHGRGCDDAIDRVPSLEARDHEGGSGERFT